MKTSEVILKLEQVKIYKEEIEKIRYVISLHIPFIKTEKGKRKLNKIIPSLRKEQKKYLERIEAIYKELGLKK